jgi:hypothetical protein
VSPAVHELPPNPGDVVVEWSATGGGAPAPAGGPDLVVRADASATAGARFGGGRPADGSIAPERLQSLLDTVIDDCGFFEIDGPALEGRTRAERDRRAGSAPAAEGEAVPVPLGPPYLDAALTRIAVHADGRRHEVAVQGLAAAAREYPQLRELVDLRAIELALLDLAERIGAGRPG